MAEFDPAFWTNANAKRAQINTAEAERSAGQFFATRDARNSGMGFMDSMREGMKNREAVFDPMFELKKEEMQAGIKMKAQQFQEAILSNKIKQAQIDDEAADNLAFSKLSEFKTWDERIKALNEIVPRSARGIQQATQMRLQLTQLRQMDAASRAESKLTAKQLAAANRFERGSEEWWKAVDEAETQKPQSPFGKLQADLDAEISGANRPDVVKRYLGAIEMASTNKGRSIFMGMDDNGKPIFQMAEGGATPIGSPSVATQSMAQKKLLKYEGAVQLINDLQKTIKPEYLGAKGAAGEILVDRGLAQLAPEMANRDRIDFRAGLIAARESLMREINDDTRFSNADREEVAKALPSSGIFESLPDAQQRLETVRRILSQRGKIYSEGIGIKAPLWSLSKDEILKEYNDFKQSGGKKGISYDAAMEALTRFH